MFPQLPEAIGEILRAVEGAGGQGYVVGGAVRDLFLGQMPEDWDLTATLQKRELQALFPAAADTGGPYGTLRLGLPGGHCEITPCRIESGYKDGRHPENVQFCGNLLLDLWRRDFTVNAMAYNGSLLVDPFGGQEDLQLHILRCVGSPRARFKEDPLRILRMFRFSAALGFQAELSTLNAALECAGETMRLSHTRVRWELEKILLSKGPQTLGPLVSCGALQGYGLCYAPPLASLSRTACLPLCRWWALITLCRADVATVGEAFGFSNGQLRQMEEYTRLYRAGPAKNHTALKTKIRGFAGDYLPLAETFAALSPYYITEPAFIRRIQAAGEPYRLRELAIDGDALKAQGISGERCGRVLEELLTAVIQNPALNRPKALLGLARGLTKTGDAEGAAPHT